MVVQVRNDGDMNEGSSSENGGEIVLLKDKGC